VRITRCDLRLAIQQIAAATTGYAVRVIVTRHREADEPIASEILASTTTITSPISNTAAARGVQILMDKVYTLGTTASTSYLYITKSFVSDNMHMVWTNGDTTGVPANVLEGCITVWWMVDGTGGPPVFTSTMRAWFVDN
jgi:hypothetical protein